MATAKEPHVDLTYGFGDLASQGFNVYVSGEYQKTGAIFARDRRFPFNSRDLSSYCDALLRRRRAVSG